MDNWSRLYSWSTSVERYYDRNINLLANNVIAKSLQIFSLYTFILFFTSFNIKTEF